MGAAYEVSKAAKAKYTYIKKTGKKNQLITNTGVTHFLASKLFPFSILNEILSMLSKEVNCIILFM